MTLAGQSFGSGRERWIAGLGRPRDLVRQELVTRQLALHLPDRPLRVLDAGCGQGTQAIALAGRGHEVTGVDSSPEMLLEAERAAAREPEAVRGRLRFEAGDVLDLADEHRRAYDLVCSHGVSMYLPSLTGLVESLATAAVRPGGLVSVLTRNRAGIAMRAGMTRDWRAALEGFDATRYTNRLGVANARADEPEAVRAALARAGADTVGWYGVRLFTDHWDDSDTSDDLALLLDAEEEAGRRDPYRAVAALTHTIARVR